MPARQILSLVFVLLALAYGALGTSLGWTGLPLVSMAMAQEEDDDEDDEEDDEDEDDDEDDGGRRNNDRDDDDDEEEGERGNRVVRTVFVPAPPAFLPSRPQPSPELLITLSEALTVRQIESLGFNVLATETIDLIGRTVARLALPENLPVSEARQLLAELSTDTRPVENTLYALQALPCTPEGCASLDMMGWNPGSTCEASPRIGMIDTPVDAARTGLEGGRIETFSALSSDRQPAPSDHGSAIAALMVGQPGSAAPGPLPNAELIAAGAFHRGEFGAISADAFDIVRALDTLSRRDLDVLNMSLAGEDNALVAAAIDEMLASGVQVVAAVGNRGPASPPQFPAAQEGVVAVTAVDAEYRIYRQALHGEHVDFAAPGVDVWVADPEGGNLRSGTSFASPLVAAALALGTSPEDLSADAIDLGETGWDPVFGYGLVQFPGC